MQLSWLPPNHVLAPYPFKYQSFVTHVVPVGFSVLPIASHKLINTLTQRSLQFDCQLTLQKSSEAHGQRVLNAPT